MHRVSLLLIVAVLTSAEGQQSGNANPRSMFRITGTVVNGTTGDPLAQVQVTIGRSQDADAAQSVVTAKDGRFQFGQLAPGKYWLAAQGHGFSPQRFNEHGIYSTAIVVGPDLKSDGLVFPLRPDATIMGTVFDEQNEPVRSAQVMLFRAAPDDGATSTQSAGQSITDDRGIYRFSHRPPGTYFVAVKAEPWYANAQPRARGESMSAVSATVDPTSRELADREFDVTYPVTYYSGTIDPGGATPIVLGSGDRATADITLAPVPALHLRITGVDASQGIGVILVGRTLGGGRIALNARQNVINNHELEIDGIPPGQFDLTLYTGRNHANIREQHIDLSNDVATDVASASVPQVVTGIVRLDTGKPLPAHSSVAFFDRASGQSFGAQISDKGEFKSSGEGVRSGVYDVFVSGLTNGVVKQVVADGAKVIGQQVEIPSGTSASLVVTVSQGVGRVDGTVLRDGNGLAGAMVVLVPQNIAHNLSLVRRDQSDSDGTFSLANVLPGKYTVIALANGWDKQWTNPNVLKPYLSHGSVVDVAANGRYSVKVDVQ